MIINCPCCKKKFEIDPSLIPEKGRLLQCGSCEQTWFLDRNQQNQAKPIIDNQNVENKPITSSQKKDTKKKLPKKDKINSQLNDNKNDKKDFEIIEYKSKSIFNLAKLLSYLIVLIISFIGFLIVVDTFKFKLYKIFPNLELLIFSLFETLKDIVLFAKDLI